MLATKSPSHQALGLMQPPVGLTDGCSLVPSPGACEGSALGPLRCCSEPKPGGRSSEPYVGTEAVTEVHRGKGIKLLKDLGAPRSPARLPSCGSQVKPPRADHYQVHQHLHHSVVHKVL